MRSIALSARKRYIAAPSAAAASAARWRSCAAAAISPAWTTAASAEAMYRTPSPAQYARQQRQMQRLSGSHTKQRDRGGECRLRHRTASAGERGFRRHKREPDHSGDAMPPVMMTR